ncbi:hypothetical protein BESB_052230 [Besnoitia besnoiti]|uniref:Uncharacterized protein n=1 Tax=Besnoitia besnoiti TaxID=94643 RepID=A0A2A9MJL1_BESBE|nr:hypothetical protein BESB_052230 [Besnoitia besnoiti]PFH35572.1 hypothetical protein BESB_052230 [Besnoitia besnoiti]
MGEIHILRSRFRQRILNTFRTLCYTVKQTPLNEEGQRSEINTIKAWIRARSTVSSEDEAKRVLAGLRYKRGELEEFVALAKYRFLKRQYPPGGPSHIE